MRPRVIVEADIRSPEPVTRGTHGIRTLIYETRDDFETRGSAADPARREAYWARWPVYTKALQDAGIMRGGGTMRDGVDSPWKRSRWDA